MAKILKQTSNSHKGVELWAKSISNFGRNFGRHFSWPTSAKILAAMYACVPQAMAQFGLKIEKLSHIINSRMARAYRSPSLIRDLQIGLRVRDRVRVRVSNFKPVTFLRSLLYMLVFR